jgi:hypothetical protein
MKLLLALLLVAAPLARAADVSAVTFYLQLVQGSDQDNPPTPQAHTVGAKLDQRLHNVFRWKNYWELKRETVTLAAGGKSRKDMSPRLQVEVAWPTTDSLMVSIFKDGKLLRRRHESINTAFSIAGGSSNANEPWFIIVRRDNPDESREAGTKMAAMP